MRGIRPPAGGAGSGSRREDPRQLAEELSSPGERPLVSVVLPTYNSDLRWLREAIDSVLSQAYPEWELRIVDDGSTEPGVRTVIERSGDGDDRVKPLFLERNIGISAATNAALEKCEGRLVAFLDHDDVLAPQALLRVVREFADGARADIVYSDQDKLNTAGERVAPFLKPDWSPVHALGVMYVGHLLAVRRAFIEGVGGMDPAYDGVQDFEWLLRLSEHAREIHHIPEILYHWRATPGSVAAGEDEKPGIAELQADAVSAHLGRRGIPASAVPHPTIPHRARLVPDRRRRLPTVSIVIAQSEGGERLQRCIESVLDHTATEAVEVIVVVHPEAERCPAEDRIELVEREPGPFHRPQANNVGALQARGELLLFLSDQLEAIEADWIRHLVLLAKMPGVGPVGPLLAFPDGLVGQAGWVIGLDHPVTPAMEGLKADSDGHYGALSCPREVSALSCECMMVDEELFSELGGFREAYRTGFEDFDFCQRAMRKGRIPVYSPLPTVVSHETPAAHRSSFDVVDRALFVDLFYDELLEGDPFYNRGFKRDRADFEPAGVG